MTKKIKRKDPWFHWHQNKFKWKYLTSWLKLEEISSVSESVKNKAFSNTWWGALFLYKQLRNIYSDFKTWEQIRQTCTDGKISKDDLKRQLGQRGSYSIILFV